MDQGPFRVTLTMEEAAIVVAALRFWHDTFLEPEEGEEATHLYVRAERIEGRVVRALHRRGLMMEADR